jgi:hypothetical protein
MAEASEPAPCPEGHADTIRLMTFLAASRPDRANGGAAMSGGGGCCGGACGCR